jgi:membrane fusion protein, multidrug efflux system
MRSPALLKWLWAPFLAVLALVLWGSWAWADADKKKSATEAAALATQNQAILVHAASVTVASMPEILSALGSLVATQKVMLNSEVAGQVQSVLFKDGQSVEKGMPVVQLDSAQAQADYDTAVTKLQQDRKHYQRAKIIGSAAFSEEDLEGMLATIKNDQASLEAKQAALNQKTVTAPFAGILGAFKVHEGDYVSAGQPVVDLVNNAQVKVLYTLPENVLPKLKKNQQITVTATAYPKKVFYGTVIFISPTIDEDTRTVSLQALIPNPDNILSPGMFVHCSQQVSVDPNALVLPLAALQAGIKGYSVYKVEKNTALLTEVTLGTRQHGLVQIKSGLQKGDLVVTDGAMKLQNGSPVRVMASNTASSSSDAASKASSLTPAAKARSAS